MKRIVQNRTLDLFIAELLTPEADLRQNIVQETGPVRIYKERVINAWFIIYPVPDNSRFRKISCPEISNQRGTKNPVTTTEKNV